ncbi:MAG TPA: 2,5-diamino-6-(ribosylamino)-4(3H)-pyrimidinone 5'-phosphate reductase [Nitrosopumilaceae archaeon]|nr:2,5-diamino-6-(ribosylamino)-4(3H)-pyrimidinone 5'-phosphate reductase [Nitrosopumilaceae archaeon]
MVKSRPYVLLSAAVSLDGKIASKTGDSKLSSKKDLVRVHKLRSNVDAILVGKRTIIHDDPSLTVRYVKGQSPIRIILDSNGSIKSSSKIIQTCRKIPTIIVVTEAISKKNIARLQRHGLEVIKCGRREINLKKLLHILKKKNIKKLLVEGGGTTNWSFFKNGLIDEIIITLTPFILGGKEAISLVEGDGFSKISKSRSFKLKSIRRIKNELVIRYVV